MIRRAGPVNEPRRIVIIALVRHALAAQARELPCGKQVLTCGAYLSEVLEQEGECSR
jgi:hypothetical protein